MDDQRRKLLVVSAANPSLRLSVAPQSIQSNAQLRVATPQNSQRLFLPDGRSYVTNTTDTDNRPKKRELPKLNFAQKLRDVVDANTEADRIKRINAGQNEFYTKGNAAAQAGQMLLGGFDKTRTAVDALTGHLDREAAELDKAYAQRKISREQYMLALQKQGERTAFAGTGYNKDGTKQGFGNRFATAAGVGIEGGLNAIPFVGGAFKLGAAGLAKATPAVAAMASDVGTKATVGQITRTGAKIGAGYGGTFGFGNSLQGGDLSLKKTAIETGGGAFTGGIVGAGGAYLGATLSKLLPKKPLDSNVSKYLAGETDEKAINSVLSQSLGIGEQELADLSKSVAESTTKRGVNNAVKKFIKDYVPFNEKAYAMGNEAVAKELAKIEDPQIIKEVIDNTNSGLSEKAKASLIQKLATEKDPTTITKLLDAADNIVPTTKAGTRVNSVPSKELVDGGYTTNKIVRRKADKLPLGSDTYGDMDPAQVQDYVNRITAGETIDPVIVKKGVDGNYTVVDGKHRLEAMKQLDIKEVPTVEVPPKTGEISGADIQNVQNKLTGTGDVQRATAKATGDTVPNTAPVTPEVSTNQATVAKEVSEQATQKPSGSILDTGNPDTLPKEVSQRGFAKSLSQTETPEAVYADLLGYTTKPNASTFAQAEQDILANEQAIVQEILAKGKGTLNDVDNARALLLMDKAIAEDNTSLAQRLASKINVSGTENARAVQILSAVNKTTPSGALREVDKIITEAQEKGLLSPDFILDPAKVNAITDQAKYIQTLEMGSREHEIAVALLAKQLTDIVPPTIGDKLNSIVNISLLLNPKTFVRNVIGNTAGAVAETASTAVATPLDMLASLRTGNRTVSLPSILKRLGGFGEGLKQGAQETELGIRIGTGGKYDISPAIFENRVLARIEKTLGHSLSDFDKAFAKAQFDDTLNSLMKANKVSKPTQEMLDIAEQEGLYATYQGDSFIAKSLQSAKGWLNKASIKGFGLGDVVVRYPKTPGNLVAVGMDYSPYGFAKGLLQFVKLNEGSNLAAQRAAVRNLGRGITGTGLIAGGYYLAQNNIITAKKSSDKDLNSLQRQQGQPPFSFNITALGRLLRGEDTRAREGDVISTYDWLQPNAIQLSMGANMALNKDKGSSDWISNALDQAATGLETIEEQPVLAQTGRFFKTATTSADQGGGIPNAITDAVTGVPSMFVPSVVNQTAAVLDKNARTTYDPNPVKQGANKVIGKLPFANQTLEPVIDTFGNEVMRQQTDNPLTRIFNSFVNPAFVTKIQRTPEGQMVLDIYNNTGITDQVPRVAAKKQMVNTDGSEGSKAESYTLSAKQLTEFQKVTGKLAQETFAELSSNPAFMALPDEEKAKVMADKLGDINSFAKMKVLGNQPKTMSQGVKALASGRVGDFSSKTPEGVEGVAKSYFEKIAYMDDKTLKEYLKSAPDDIATAVASELNKGRPANTNEIPAYNGLAKRYAEYQKNKAEAQAEGKWSKIDEVEKEQEFWKGAIKDSRDELTKDVYEAGSSGAKGFWEKGYINKADIDKAIELDNELYSSGLSKTLKFSKTFRRQYGYGVPANPDGSSGGGSGGGRKGGKGKKGEAKKAVGINELKLRFNPPEAPNISSVPKRPKAKFKFTVPGSVQVTPVRLKL